MLGTLEIEIYVQSQEESKRCLCNSPCKIWSRFNFSFQEAALLVSLIAAKVKRERGENGEEGSLASEVEKLVVEHIISQ